VWFYALLLVAILNIVFLLTYYFAPQLYYPQVKSQLIGPLDLSKEGTAFDAASCSAFAEGAGATIEGFFFINPLQRTPTAISCNSPGNPSCEDGRFHTCVCASMTDCTNCSRNGYIPLIKVADVFTMEILSAPDAGRQGKAMAQLAIKTGTVADASGNTSTSHIEFIALPAVSLQKWTMISIVREGRRYDVYYDGALVASKKTTYMMANIGSPDAVKIGHPGFNGYAALLNFYDFVRSGLDASASYSKLSDTRGVPYVQLPSDVIAATSSMFAMPNVSLNFKMPSLCPSGSCIHAPQVRPAQPWMDWDTEYA